jgi:hypothetical protein
LIYRLYKSPEDNWVFTSIESYADGCALIKEFKVRHAIANMKEPAICSSHGYWSMTDDRIDSELIIKSNPRLFKRIQETIQGAMLLAP